MTTDDTSRNGGGLFPAAHSLITGAALQRLVRHDFGLCPAADIRLIQSGLNDHYALHSDRGEYIVRVYRSGWRSNDEVTWELDLLQHLAVKGAPVAPAIRRLDGGWFSEIQAIEGLRQVALFERATGPYMHFGSHDRHRISPAAHAEEFGRSMAEIHAAADSFHSTLPRFQLNLDYLLDQPLHAIAQVYSHREAGVRELQERAAQYRHLLIEGGVADLEWGVIHGDMTGGNSTYWEGRAVHFDFDFAGPGWRAYDLGVFVWSMSINGYGSEIWERFWRGYSSHRSLPPRDLSLVPAFAGVRELWLMGLWCSMAPVLGLHTLHDDYFDRVSQRVRRFYDDAVRRITSPG